MGQLRESVVGTGSQVTANLVDTGALAGASLVLAGGTLVLDPTASTASNGLATKYINTAQQVDVLATDDFLNSPPTTPTPPTFQTAGVGNATANLNSSFSFAGPAQTAAWYAGQSATPTQFAVRFTGMINITQAGPTTFQTGSDDGSKLYIDGVLVANSDGPHGVALNSSTVNLTAGLHNIQVDYVQGGGGDTLQVSYGPAGGPLQLIPFTALYTPDNLLLPNTVTASGNSTITLNGGAFSTLGLGALTFDNAAAADSLTVNAQAGKKLTFASTALLASGTNPITLNDTADVALSTNTPSQGSVNLQGVTLVKQGTGKLFLDNASSTANTLTGTVDIQGGKVVAIGSGVVGATNPLGAAAVTIDGSGGNVGTLSLDSAAPAVLGASEAVGTTTTAANTGTGSTVTVTVANTFVVGQAIYVTGSVPATFNGVFMVTAASAGSFSYFDPTPSLVTPLTTAGVATATSSAVWNNNITATASGTIEAVQGTALMELTGSINVTTGSLLTFGSYSGETSATIPGSTILVAGVVSGPGGVLIKNTTVGTDTTPVGTVLFTNPTTGAATLTGAGSAFVVASSQTITTASPFFAHQNIVVPTGVTLTVTETGNAGLANVSSISVNAGGALVINDTAAGVTGTLGATTVLNLNGGAVSIIGNATAATNTAESFGAINVNAGASSFTMTKGAGGTLTVTAAALNPTAGATVDFRVTTATFNVTATPTSTNGILSAGVGGPAYATYTVPGTSYDFAQWVTGVVSNYTAYTATSLTGAGSATAIVKISANDNTIAATGTTDYAVLVSGTVTVAGAGTLSTSNLFQNNGANTFNLPVNFGAGGLLSSQGTTTFNAALSGASLTVNGGTTTFNNNANSVTSTVLVSGTLVVGSSTPGAAGSGLGTSNLTLVNGTVQAALPVTVSGNVTISELAAPSAPRTRVW